MKKNTVIVCLSILLLFLLLAYRTGVHRQQELEREIYALAVNDIRTKRDKLSNFIMFLDEFLNEASAEEAITLSEGENILLLNMRHNQAYSTGTLPPLWKLDEFNIMWRDNFASLLTKERLEQMTKDELVELRAELQLLRDMITWEMDYSTRTLTLDIEDLMAQFYQVNQILLLR